MMLAVSLVFNLALIGINVVLGLIGFGANKLAGAEIGAVVGIGGGLIGLVLWGVGALGNFAIIAYSGFSSAKKSLDLISCGLVGLLLFTVVGIITGVISLILGFLNLGANVVTSSDAATGLFGGIFGAVGMGIGFICGIGFFILGMILNFAIAAICGMIGGAK